ncbi:MAG: type 4a pilus biogenesis protein PilO [Candidatus Nealsonbacteria bacterium]|nr:type 4a pilus biogenesis protein PilO [Candidatus Nealsonbacteria bacterium]
MPRRLMIIIIMLIAALILGFFFVWPEYQDFQLIQTESAQKKTELDSKADYYDYFKKTWEGLEKYKDALSKVDNAIPQTYSLPSLFNYLQETAGESGLVLEDLNFRGIAGENTKEISFGLQVSGSYNSFKSLLSSLENSIRIFKVKSVSFSSPKKGEKSFSFDLEVATYSY